MTSYYPDVSDEKSEHARRIFVGKLSFDVSESMYKFSLIPFHLYCLYYYYLIFCFTISMPDELKDYFSRFGPVADIIMPKVDVNKNKGFAFVTFQDRSSMNKALSSRTHEINGREVSLGKFRISMHFSAFG